MQPFTYLVISDDNDGDKASEAVDARFVLMATAQAVFSDGAAAGTLKLQGSNDPVNQDPTRWNDIPSATASVSSGATTTTPILATYFCYRWMRVVWTHSGGAGTIAVSLHGWGG